MRTTRAVCAAASFCLCVGLASTAAAQQPPADAAAAQALRAEIDQLRADFTARLTALEAKLANEQFMKNAPAAVIQGAQSRRIELQARLEKLQQNQ